MTPASYTEMLNGFADAAFVLAGDRTVRAANSAAEQAFGAIPLGADFVRIMRRPEVLHLIEQCLQGEPRLDDVLTLDAALRGRFRVTVARLGEGGVVISFSDLSDIQIATRMRSDFIANVSHELRSPLTALSGFIETLRGPARDDPKAQQRFLELMTKEAGRMDRLIADLMSLSKVEINARVPPRAQVDLSALLQRVAATLAPGAEKSNTRLALDAPQHGLIAPGDEDQLIQVFQNLIENAIKYGGGDQTVAITARRLETAPGIRGPAIAVSVMDEGPGIAADHLPRLTERFYRIDTGRSREKGGTGLGLAIVKHIVQRHRGRLLIDSAVGKGATFSVHLPAAQR